MGVCYGTPDFPTPTHTGSLKSNMKLTISSSSSGGCGPSGFDGDGDGGESANILPQPNLTIFTKAQLQEATGNFHGNSYIGEGGFGLVYKGLVETEISRGRKSIIAVKRLQESSIQGNREWRSEVNLLGRINHPNIVKLLGYCPEDKKDLMLVYEFVQKGSLDNHLFGKGAMAHPLSWELRIRIALEAAKGLAFLHSPEVNIIYRDFKTSNILLDASYTAKLADFGLARQGPVGGESHVSTRVVGTMGYAAPEYISTGHLFLASDVYSYGVVLLEMMTGSKAMDRNRYKGKHDIVDWSKQYLSSKRKIITVMDPNLKGRYPITAAMLMARLATECLEHSPTKRPPMSEVVRRMEEIAKTS